jgi:hypothetical protein
MAQTVDKVILTNSSALKAKYGAKGLGAIQEAVKSLIQADKARGIQAQLIFLDDQAAMARLSAQPVTIAGNPKQNKDAIDAVYRKLAPDYLMLLGSIDIIPHQDLKNPLYTDPNGNDPDPFAYGDLPYACEAPYSREAHDFVGPTRVVGRLPDITGGTDPDYLIALLKRASRYKPIDHEAFMNYFAVTAQIWEASTRLSVTNAFGNSTSLEDVPPRGYKWKPSQLSRLSHFFNCHGADQSSQFFGQPASGAQKFPPSIDAAYIQGKIREGTIVAAECCYGGQLYAITQLVSQVGLCNTYLANGCYGYFASTTIAYGPATGNGQADYMCQFFMKGVAAGASIGRAALQARQQFVKTASPPDPSDIKTLAQFNLYGDPSITPIPVPQAYKSLLSVTAAGKAAGMRTFAAARSERKDRRRQLYNSGIHIAETEFVPRRRGPTPRAVSRSLRAQARELGWEDGNLLSFRLLPIAKTKGRLPKSLTASAELPAAYHVLFKARPKDAHNEVKGRAIVPSIVALIGKEINGKVVSVTEIHSR